jgi:hypothetical protein
MPEWRRELGLVDEAAYEAIAGAHHPLDVIALGERRR